MARSFTFRRSVLLAASAADVWAVAVTPAGVGDELRPLVRMTFPPEVADLTSDDLTMGETVCHCWLLAGGFVPFDRHALAFESIRTDPSGESFGFVEESTSTLQERWRHERTVAPVGDRRCRITDRVTVVPRVALAMPVLRRVVPLVFEHRHRRLVGRWGSA